MPRREHGCAYTKYYCCWSMCLTYIKLVKTVHARRILCSMQQETKKCWLVWRAYCVFNRYPCHLSVWALFFSYSWVAIWYRWYLVLMVQNYVCRSNVLLEAIWTWNSMSFFWCFCIRRIKEGEGFLIKLCCKDQAFRLTIHTHFDNTCHIRKSGIYRSICQHYFYSMPYVS